MTLALPPSLQRMLALGLAALVTLALWLGVARPLLAHFAEQRDALARERVMLGRFLAAGNRSATAGDIERRINEVLGGEALLKGESDAIRLANLQTLVGEIAARGNIRPRSVRTLPRREQGGLAVLGVRIQLQSDLASVQALLHRLESAETLLLLSGLQMTRAAGTGGGPTELDVRLDILGVARKEGG
ncbi:MAG: type II secretion system protein GspM [Hyphomicrobiaceae bacterium]